MTRDETIKLLMTLSVNYPQAAKAIKNPKETAVVWEMNLGEFPAEAVYKAARLHMSTSKYFPNPADIREKITRAKLIYTEPELKEIEAPKTDKRREDYYLEELCRFVGLGYDEPDDNADLLCDFLPYEK